MHYIYINILVINKSNHSCHRCVAVYDYTMCMKITR